MSFNYTDTYKTIYDVNAINTHYIEYDFIHGKADINNTIESNNMVLGIDEYLIGKAKNKETMFIEFKKYFQRIYKRTGCKYKKWLMADYKYKKWFKLNHNSKLNIFIF